MQFSVTVDIDGAAFDGLPGYELARIFSDLASDMATHGAAVARSLVDSNGNVVGKSELSESKCYGWTNWDTREVSTLIDSFDNWHNEALDLHVNELREVFGPIVEDFTAGSDGEVDLSAVDWVEVYAALHDC